MDAAAMFGGEFFDRQRIGKVIRIESVSLIPDHDEHSLVPFAAATDVHQFAGIQAIAVDHRVTQGFPKREFDGGCR
jgi:hypothetical protein